MATPQTTDEFGDPLDLVDSEKSRINSISEIQPTTSEWDEPIAANEADDYGDPHEMDERHEVDENIYQAKETKEKVKGKPVVKVIAWTLAALFATGGGLFAYSILTTEPPAPEVVVQPVTKPITPAPVAPPAPEPGGYDPLLDNANPATVPTAAPVSQMDTSVAAPVDTTLSPFGSAQHQSQTTVPTAPAMPAAVTNVTTGTVNGATNAISPAPAQAPTADAMTALEKAQDARIQALEDKIAELTAMIEKLTAPKPKRETPVYREPKAPVVKKEPEHKKEVPSKKDKAEVVAPVAHVAQENAMYQPTTQPAPAPLAAKSAARPYLVAIVPGRAFLQNSEGVRSDIAVGDQVAGCGAAIKIDADASEVVTERCVIR